MAYQKILTVQDISCVGQCSLTVALPILSACGLETCILPSAVLSTHTAGFTGLVPAGSGRGPFAAGAACGFAPGTVCFFFLSESAAVLKFLGSSLIVVEFCERKTTLTFFLGAGFGAASGAFFPSLFVIFS